MQGRCVCGCEAKNLFLTKRDPSLPLRVTGFVVLLGALKRYYKAHTGYTVKSQPQRRPSLPWCTLWFRFYRPSGRLLGTPVRRG